MCRPRTESTSSHTIAVRQSSKGASGSQSGSCSANQDTKPASPPEYLPVSRSRARFRRFGMVHDTLVGSTPGYVGCRYRSSCKQGVVCGRGRACQVCTFQSCIEGSLTRPDQGSIGAQRSPAWPARGIRVLPHPISHHKPLRGLWNDLQGQEPGCRTKLGWTKIICPCKQISSPRPRLANWIAETWDQT
jgi:hypothetical protein